MEGDTAKTSVDPPETDLDYYSRPENYEGSNLTNIKRFNFAKQKEDKAKLDALKSKKKKKDGFDLFKRYRHILKGYLDADIEPDEPDTSEDEGEESSSKKIKFIAEEDSKSEKSEIEKQKTGESIKKEEKLDVKIESFVLCETQIDTPDTPTDSGYRTGTETIEKERSLSITPVDISGSQFAISGRKSASVRSSVSMKGNLLSRELRSRQAKDMWRKYTRFIIMVHKLSSAAGQGDTDMGMKTFTDIASEAETSTLKSSGLSFDPNYFKAKKEINISTEVKNILSLPSEQRSPEQIQTAMFGLQSLRSFAEYPLHMQEKLASVAWFELVPPKRIIIRQGHFAENFYFILSGQAVVTLLLKDPKTGASFVKTATIMRKGMSFGELALLHHSRRTATVTSQGTVQLLTIGRADFFDIFMSGAGPDDIPDHIKFISQCDFMKDWPIENLLEHPEKCLLHFFKRNVVIVKDSTYNEWIYVVKSGFCQVLKQLKGVTPRLGFNTRQNADNDPSIPKLPGLIKEAKVDTGLRRKRRSKSAPVKEENEENSPPEEQQHKAPEAQTFSKDQYSKNPTTLKAHFAVKIPKQNYVIPEKCRPPKPIPEPKELSTGKLPPVYVQVEALKPRDAFGLETIEFDSDAERTNTVVSLVSRGAECIMLSKEFFMKHANEKVKRLIRHQVQPYPEDEAFQNNLQIKSDWQLYRQSLITTLTSNL